ncbi:MAG TPA: NACHT domain-containing protein [Actinophytocola sp.]|uniref:NACHT domain-containing protein n=1 Tax=Actinophytocola sp. TaxID=1872138 RepID=UPI002DDC9470|nr:NACHT domain-containing protein [Actinophytocola sp.]HEV2779967.1 NACHT domain-containing protein [Actinophytocola sp.]
MSRPADPDEAFADRYREFMVRTLDGFEFFGVDPRGVPRRHSFERGYVALTLNQRDLGDDATVTAGARADQALRNHRRALVRGVAGSGKSTLLRWLGANIDEPATVPVLLELGRYADGQPPDLAEAVAAPLRPRMPAGWMHRMLAGGRVLLLLDGLEEVRPRERSHLEQWVEHHLAVYPDTRCVVTTRPSVVAEQWWADRGFQRFDLLPMSRHSIDKYVHGWHEMARDDHPEGSDARESLHHTERRLLATLSNRPALRGMSANPLLCGLLCALHMDRGEHLPENRKQVYDAALDLLLSRWPAMRRQYLRTGTPETHIPTEDVALSKEEQEKLLQRLAFWLVTNLEPVLTPEDAKDRMPSFMSGLRSEDEDPERVLRYLAHESGLLRELPSRSLEFLHRTFRDHLAAKEVVDEAYFGLMLDNADKPHWHDVVVMAGAHARPTERQRILLTLLERGKADHEHREALYLLAAAILEQATVLPADSQHVRNRVTEAMAELIPPRTPGAADQLAAAGEFVLDLLPGPGGLTAWQSALVVRAAARIAAQWNPPGAVEKILQFTANPSTGVINELLEPWGRLGDYEKYARDVLSEIDFRRFTVDLQNGRRIEHIGHLRTITNLVLRNDMRDLTPLADLPELRRLTLRDNMMTTLDPLTRSASLRVLVLDRCSSLADARPVDLSPLAGIPGLRRLVISGITSKVDLASLAGVRLDSLALRGSVALPAGLHVRHLTLSSAARRMKLAGVHGIRSIILDWAPDDDELAMLAGLPDLRRLVLWRVPPNTPAPELPGVNVTMSFHPAGGALTG